jgi:hypothetical protein
MSSIIKSEENGIEFYTIAATGESGMSQSGLAILCGVARQTLQSMLKTLAEKELAVMPIRSSESYPRRKPAILDVLRPKCLANGE